MKLYIVGPVTGMSHGNLTAFQAAANELEAVGYETIIPYRLIYGGIPRIDAVRISSAKMVRSDGVALLDGWESCEYARLERHIANHVSLPAHPVDQWVTLAENTMERSLNG